MHYTPEFAEFISLRSCPYQRKACLIAYAEGCGIWHVYKNTYTLGLPAMKPSNVRPQGHTRIAKSERYDDRPLRECVSAKYKGLIR